MNKTVAVMAVVTLTSLGSLRAQPPGGPHGGWHHNPLEEMSNTLNLSDAQKAKIQPIVDAAKPQLQSIHEEAMSKAKAVVENSLAQIRPLLNPEQQAKLDSLAKAHEDLRNAMKELHEAKSR